MYQRITVIWLLLFPVLMTGCKDRCTGVDGPREAKERALGEVQAIRLEMVANIHLQIDTSLTPTMEIIAQKGVHDLLNIQQLDRELYIGLTGCVKEHDEIEMNAFFKRLTSVENASAGLVKSEDRVDEDTLHFINTGLGDIDFVVQSRHVVSEIKSSGDIILSGSTSRLDFLSSGSGDLRAFNLVADTIDMHIIGSSLIEVYTDGVLMVHFYRDSKVTYRGTPTEIIVIGEGEVVASEVEAL